MGTKANAGSVCDELPILDPAGKGTLEAAAFEAAGRSFRSAFSNLVGTDIKERADLLKGVVIAEPGLARWDSAFAALTEAFEIYIGLGDREMIAKSCTELAGVLVWAGRLCEATETGRRGKPCDAITLGTRASLLSLQRNQWEYLLRSPFRTAKVRAPS